MGGRGHRPEARLRGLWAFSPGWLASLADIHSWRSGLVRRRLCRADGAAALHPWSFRRSGSAPLFAVGLPIRKEGTSFCRAVGMVPPCLPEPSQWFVSWPRSRSAGKAGPRRRVLLSRGGCLPADVLSPGTVSGVGASRALFSALCCKAECFSSPRFTCCLIHCLCNTRYLVVFRLKPS